MLVKPWYSLKTWFTHLSKDIAYTFLSFFLIKLIIVYAKNLNLIDTPNERSTHTKTIPLGAGIGFISAMLLGLATYDISIIIGKNGTGKSSILDVLSLRKNNNKQIENLIFRTRDKTL